MTDHWAKAVETVERYLMRTERDEERIDDMLRAALPHLVEAVLEAWETSGGEYADATHEDFVWAAKKLLGEQSLS
jgi:hypothetical protein